MADVRLTNLGVELDGHVVLTDCNVTIPDGSFTAVVGPSGSGKSSLLRAVAGLIPTSGGVAFGEVDVTSVEPAQRDIGMVFQEPVLFPRRSVRRNVSFPLEIRRETAESIRERVDAESRAMHIENLLQRDPRHLSRGEQQLVQIARAMVRAPRVLLLDEPFAPLDEHLRHRMRSEIKVLQDGYGVTTLMATNDPVDIAMLATDVVVLGPAERDGGRSHSIVQAGSRSVVADEPASLNVAGAMGVLWTFEVEVGSDPHGFWLTTPPQRGALRYRAWAASLEPHVGETVIVGVRGGDLVASDDGDGDLVAVIDRLVPGAAEPLVCRVGSRVVSAATGARSITSFARHEDVRLRIGRLMVFDLDGGRLM